MSRTDLTPGLLTSWADIKEYLWGGAATFTLRSLKSGARFTYRVRVKKDDVAAGLKGAELTYFVSLLRGPDNTSDYAYMGVLRQPGAFFLTSASRLTRDADSVKVLLWFLDKLQRERNVLRTTAHDSLSSLGGTSFFEFWHSGVCGRCGRALTVPESLARGIGPECVQRIAL